MLNIEPEIKRKTKNTTKVVHVCVAVIERNNPFTNVKEVLISKRPEHVHQGGLWEFPGGKLEQNETIIDALDRELFEELDIRIKPLAPSGVAPEGLQPLIQIHHEYPDKSVFLDVWRVKEFSGEPKGKEGQLVRWLDVNQLKTYSFPEANEPIIRACLLPNRYFITPVYTSILDAEHSLKHALAENAQLIYFRQPQLEMREYASWVEQLLAKQPELQSKLMYQFVETIQKYAGAGVHLSFARSKQFSKRPIIDGKWFTVSCHDESEINHAMQLNSDFVMLSPVLKTKSHPDQIGMGWDEFKRLVLIAETPVYGLGGLNAEHEPLLINSRSQGLAGISFWQ